MSDELWRQYADVIAANAELGTLVVDLQARLAEAERDAARYREWKRAFREGECGLWNALHDANSEAEFDAAIDAAIDAAMRATDSAPAVPDELCAECGHEKGVHDSKLGCDFCECRLTHSAEPAPDLFASMGLPAVGAPRCLHDWQASAFKNKRAVEKTCVKCGLTETADVAPKTLLDFGYAPGNYQTLPCMDCGQTHIADKRASRCKPCAEKRLAETVTESLR